MNKTIPGTIQILSDGTSFVDIFLTVMKQKSASFIISLGWSIDLPDEVYVCFSRVNLSFCEKHCHFWLFRKAIQRVVDWFSDRYKNKSSGHVLFVSAKSWDWHKIFDIERMQNHIKVHMNLNREFKFFSYELPESRFLFAFTPLRKTQKWL